jgi:hypothetical protein
VTRSPGAWRCNLAVVEEAGRRLSWRGQAAAVVERQAASCEDAGRPAVAAADDKIFSFFSFVGPAGQQHAADSRPSVLFISMKMFVVRVIHRTTKSSSAPPSPSLLVTFFLLCVVGNARQPLFAVRLDRRRTTKPLYQANAQNLYRVLLGLCRAPETHVKAPVSRSVYCSSTKYCSTKRLFQTSLSGGKLGQMAKSGGEHSYGES